MSLLRSNSSPVPQLPVIVHQQQPQQAMIEDEENVFEADNYNNNNNINSKKQPLVTNGNSHSNYNYESSEINEFERHNNQPQHHPHPHSIHAYRSSPPAVPIPRIANSSNRLSTRTHSDIVNNSNNNHLNVQNQSAPNSTATPNSADDDDELMMKKANGISMDYFHRQPSVYLEGDDALVTDYQPVPNYNNNNNNNPNSSNFKSNALTPPTTTIDDINITGIRTVPSTPPQHPLSSPNHINNSNNYAANNNRKVTTPNSSTTTATTKGWHKYLQPFRVGIAAMKKNLIPGLILQSLALTIIILYYASPSAQQAFNSLASFKEQSSFAFSAVSTCVCGGIIPWAIMQAKRQYVRRKQSKAHELTHDLQLTSTSTTSTTTSTTSTLNATTTSSAGDTTITDRLLHSANDMSHNNQHQNALPLSKSPPPPAPQQHFHLSPNGHALHSSTTIATNPQADNHIVLNGNDIPLETIQLDSPAGTDQNTNNHSSEADGVVTPVPLNFWSELAFYIFFWIYKGIEVDAFYTLQGIMFGNEATAKCIIPKVIVDQFVYNPPWGTPSLLAGYLWKDLGFSCSLFLPRLCSRHFWFVHNVQTLCSMWLVWLPAVSMIYALPGSLQIPLFNVVLVFWSLMMELLAK